MIGSNHDISEFRQNTGILIASFAGMMFGVAAIPFYTLSVFAGPVTQDMGWTMLQFQSAFTFIIIGTLFSPVVGHLSDRWGSRRIAIFSMIVFALSLMLLGLAGNRSLYTFYAAWALMAMVGQGTSPVVWTHIIGGSFLKHRGLAFGIVLAGSGVFAAFGPLLTAFVISGWGWQSAYIFLGLMVVAIPLPLAIFFLPRQSVGEQDLETQQTPRANRHVEEGKTLRMALMDYRFYVIGAAFFIIAFGVAGLISNMIPMLQSSGISDIRSTALVGLIGLSVICGRIITGALLDRFWAPGVAAFALLFPSVACLFLLGSVSEIDAAFAILLIGFAAGAEFDIVAFLASKYFGLRAYGKIYGTLYIALFMGAAFAPPVFGSVYDRDGSYEWLLQIFTLAFPVAALSMLLLGRYPLASGGNLVEPKTASN